MGSHPDADLIDDLANDLRKAWDATSGLARYPVSDPVWVDLARVAIERVRATDAPAPEVAVPGSTMTRPDIRLMPLTGPQAGWQ